MHGAPQHLADHGADAPPSALMHVMWRSTAACESAAEDKTSNVLLTQGESFKSKREAFKWYCSVRQT